MKELYFQKNYFANQTRYETQSLPSVSWLDGLVIPSLKTAKLVLDWEVGFAFIYLALSVTFLSHLPNPITYKVKERLLNHTKALLKEGSFWAYSSWGCYQASPIKYFSFR